MKKNYFLALVFFFTFIASSFAEQAINTELLSEKISTLLANFGENINIGILVKDAKTGKLLFKKESDRYFMPASSQKLFTAFAALQALGSDFRYQTQLYFDYKKIKNKTLNDNLYIQFSGDPTLTLVQMNSLIKSLSEAGIQELTGKVIIDDTAFDAMSMSPGTAWEDQNYCWGSPLSSLIINHNCVNATIKPGALAGQPAQLELPDYPQSMDFVTNVLTKDETEKNCQIKAKRTDEFTYTLTGCIKAGSKPQLIEMAINNPYSNTVSLLKYLLKKNQIKLSEGFEFKKFQSPTKPFARHDSPPLKEMVSTMLKDSDNTIANALFKTIGARYSHEVGSFNNGHDAILEVLSQFLPIQFPRTTLIDGAGASRYNFLTPEQIVTLLQKIYQSPGAAEFISSLALGGVDGTLKYRLKDPATLGKVFAKTGSETAISTLSGFIETKNKDILIFSIMINGFTEPVAKYKSLEDKIAKVLVEAK
ncbi:MAG: D-alanyl-D-alanine carboxypeptidase/D-alanyl-D-alanine-endopeptidase [Tatlockia sp.]|nr:D-alanyl-D-alanine carboxypeptidase/D-alanyl-D-alanine-endopeptidase [Tatlockia sp.]